MTTMPMTRPPAPPGVRPGGPTPAAPPPGAVAVDPIKLARKHKWLLGGSVLGGVVLGIAAHFALLYTVPIYTAEVIWECFPQDTSIVTLGTEGPIRDELDKFMATQAQIMTSTAVIDAAVTDPALERNAPRWHQQFVENGSFNQTKAAKRLENRLRAAMIGDTQLIRLSFWTTDKDAAKPVVQTVADAYERNRQAAVRKLQAKRLDLVGKLISDTNTSIEALQKERVRLIESTKLESLDEQINKVQASIRLLSEKLVAVRASLEAYGSQAAKMRAQLESKGGITYDDDIRMAVEQEPVIQRLRANLSEIESQQLAMQLRNIGPQHMEYKQVESLRRATEQTLTQEREKMLRREFDSQLEALTKAIAAGQAQEADLVSKLEEEQRRGTELAKTRAEIEDIKDEIAQLNKHKAVASDKLNDLKALSGLDTQYRILLLQGAQTPREVTFPKLYIMIPLGILLVVGLVVCAILLVEVVDQRVKGPTDIQMISRTRLLGLVPHAAEDPSAPARVETVFRDQPGGILAESFRQVRASLAKQMAQKEHKSLLVAAGLPGSGATTLVLNLAYALAAAEHRVLVIDANFRRPAIAKTLGLRDAPGLSDVLGNGQTLAATVQGTDNPLVTVLAAGSAEHRKVERLATPAMSALLREAEKSYDMVLIDTAPAVVAGDAVALASRCDASLLVVQALREKRGLVSRLRTELGECKAEFLGVVINGMRSSAGGYLRGNIRAAHQYRDGDE